MLTKKSTRIARISSSSFAVIPSEAQRSRGTTPRLLLFTRPGPLTTLGVAVKRLICHTEPAAADEGPALKPCLPKNQRGSHGSVHLLLLSSRAKRSGVEGQCLGSCFSQGMA